MKLVVLSVHSAFAERKTGFHFWSDILAERGDSVRFITVGFSPISLLRKAKGFKAPYNEWVTVKGDLQAYTWCAAFHPFTFYNKALNWLSGPVFSLYPYLLPEDIKREVQDADAVIIETGAGLLLTQTLKKLCVDAKFIYNVCDSFEVLTFHPIIERAAKSSLGCFDLVRLNSAGLAADFEDGWPTKYIPQGIDKSLFDRESENPYATQNNVVSVGDMLFDAESVAAMAEEFPTWHFHLIGRKAKLEKNFDNVTEHGELSFSQLVPYIQHADMGLAPYRAVAGAEYLCQSSLKMQQYSYCRLPIVCPVFAEVGRSHAFGYQPGDRQSIRRAFAAAIACDRSGIDRSAVLSWQQVLDRLLKEAGLTRTTSSALEPVSSAASASGA